jgi:hypothetical protein
LAPSGEVALTLACGDDPRSDAPPGAFASDAVLLGDTEDEILSAKSPRADGGMDETFRIPPAPLEVVPAAAPAPPAGSLLPAFAAVELDEDEYVPPEAPRDAAVVDSPPPGDDCADGAEPAPEAFPLPDAAD